MHRLVTALVLAIVLLPAASVRAADAEDAARLCERIEARYDSLETLQYTVARKTELPRQKVEEKWIFRYQEPDRFRIDYIKPVERIVVITDEDIWEYIPPANKAMHTDLSSLSGEKRREAVTRTLSRVVVDGMRIGSNIAEIESRIISAKTNPKSGIMTVETVDPPITLLLDTDKEALRSYELRNKKGQMLMRTKADNFTEVAPAFWMPQRIEVTGGYKDDYLKSFNTLRNIQVNEEIDPSRFDFTPPAGTDITEAN